jgi:hypothetical protein
MAELELLGSPGVHRAYGELVIPLGEAFQTALDARASWPANPTAEDFRALYGTERMQELATTIVDAEVKLRDLMRRDLGGEPIGKVDLLGGPEAAGIGTA